MMNNDFLIEDLMAGHRLMLGFEGCRMNDDLKYIIGQIRAAGIILFKPNIESPRQVKTLCRDCQAYAESLGLPPLMIAVDQEGGTVARLRDGFTLFDGNPFIRTEEEADFFAATTARELTGVGINMNMAPVLDWVPDGVDSIMKDRVFKGGVDTVATLGIKVINTMQANGLMAVAKHFPGIGRTVKDSHFHLPVLDIDPELLMKTDMVPFKKALDHDVSGVMLSHIFYPRLDDIWQASLSGKIVKGILRRQLGFQGLVMTDDLDMKAIQKDMKTCIRQVLSADIDLALICHKGPGIDIAHREIKKILNRDEILYQAGFNSVKRVLRYKEQYLSDTFR